MRYILRSIYSGVQVVLVRTAVECTEVWRVQQTARADIYAKMMGSLTGDQTRHSSDYTNYR